MPEQRRALRLIAASGNGFAILPTSFCSRVPSPTRLSPLRPNPAFLFRILHRGEIPLPAFISPLPTLPLKSAALARWPLAISVRTALPQQRQRHVPHDLHRLRRDLVDRILERVMIARRDEP